MATEDRYRATGQPSLADLDEHKGRGVVAVINVRPASEQASLGFDEEAEVGSRGMKYLHIPIANGGDFSVEKAQALDEFLGGVGAGGVLVHCQGGNRAAGILTLRSLLAGESSSPDEALEFGRKLGLKAPLEEPIKTLLGQISP